MSWLWLYNKLCQWDPLMVGMVTNSINPLDKWWNWLIGVATGGRLIVRCGKAAQVRWLGLLDQDGGLLCLVSRCCEPENYQDGGLLSLMSRTSTASWYTCLLFDPWVRVLCCPLVYMNEARKHVSHQNVTKLFILIFVFCPAAFLLYHSLQTGC